MNLAPATCPPLDVSFVEEPRHYFRRADTVVTFRPPYADGQQSPPELEPVESYRCRTAVEHMARRGMQDALELVHDPRRRSLAAAKKFIASPECKSQLRPLARLLDVPVPVAMPDGSVAMAARGYDDRFESWCPPDAPHVSPLPLDQSLALLRELLADFPFAGAASVTLAVARLVTPYCRGLMGWRARVPLWVFSSDQGGIGKNYLASLTPILYQGRDAPTPLALMGRTGEMRWWVSVFAMSGRRQLHFANCRGRVAQDVLAEAVQNVTFAKKPGVTPAWPNELELSLSYHAKQLKLAPALQALERRIHLEAARRFNALNRRFKRPMLHRWLAQERGEVLGAVAGLVQHWMDQDRPDGPTQFTPFPEWSRVVGGVLHACGLGDPCLPTLSD